MPPMGPQNIVEVLRSGRVQDRVSLLPQACFPWLLTWLAKPHCPWSMACREVDRSSPLPCRASKVEVEPEGICCDCLQAVCACIVAEGVRASKVTVGSEGICCVCLRAVCICIVAEGTHQNVKDVTAPYAHEACYDEEGRSLASPTKSGHDENSSELHPRSNDSAEQNAQRDDLAQVLPPPCHFRREVRRRVDHIYGAQYHGRLLSWHRL